jgi:hypothetical protein
MIPHLLAQFKQDPLLKKIRHIQYKVRPPQSNSTQSTQQKMAPLSLESAEMIRQIAGAMDDDKLKAVLLRIAAHCE